MCNTRRIGAAAGRRDLSVDRPFGLLVERVDLPLQFVGLGQQRLVELGGEVERHTVGLVVLAALAREADVDREGHDDSLPVDPGG
jgi:hypothetical protein